MASFKDIFAKGSVAEQFLLWNVLSQLSQGLLGPIAQSIANDVWSLDPTAPIPPGVAAELVARGKLVLDQGVNIAQKSGIGTENFAHLVDGAKHAPPFEVLVEGVRRKLIAGFGGEGGSDSFAAGLNDLGIDERWWNLMAEVVVNKPTGQAALNSLLQGQISHERAFGLWVQAGEDPDWFQDAFNSEGTSPTPDMLGTMANRKIIDWGGTGPAATTFEQGFLEGPWRNKWEPAMRRLMEYLPPPRTVVAMIHAGSLTDAEALDLLEKEGLTPKLAAAYVADAHHTKAQADKDLAKSDIIALYKAHKIDRAKAVELLGHLGYSPANADLVVSLADVAKADTHLTAAINRVRTLFTTHKISEQAAEDALSTLHVAAAQRSELITLWKLELSLNVKQLTEAQIVSAYEYKVLSEAEAMTELGHLGYTQFDAWVLLSIKNKKPLPNRPAQDAGVGVNP